MLILFEAPPTTEEWDPSFKFPNPPIIEANPPVPAAEPDTVLFFPPNTNEPVLVVEVLVTKFPSPPKIKHSGQFKVLSIPATIAE